MANGAQSLGNAIREGRVAKDMTLRELARELRISPSYLSDIENDRRVPAEDILRRIAELLNLSFDDLMALAGRFGEDLGNRSPTGDRKEDAELHDCTPFCRYWMSTLRQLGARQVSRSDRLEDTTVVALINSELSVLMIRRRNRGCIRDKQCVCRRLWTGTDDRDRRSSSGTVRSLGRITAPQV